MKILHTADIHIQKYNDERWKALDYLIKLARTKKVNVVVISGDLFNSDTDANKLRTKIRDLFSKAECQVLIIPGNHDAKSYPEGIFFGDQVTIVRDFQTPVKIDDAVFWGFPYEDLKDEEILRRLHEASNLAVEDASHILLIHGELLDTVGFWENYGEEGHRRYFPIKLDYFHSLNWDYVLAGHFHTNFDVHQFSPKKYFVYPGSPVSVTKREIAPRKVNLFEVGKAPKAHVLETAYYEPLEINLDPFIKIDPVSLIQDTIHQLPRHARLLLSVNGYFDSRKLGKTEEELSKSIKTAASKRCDFLELGFRDIHNILEDDLFIMFEKKLRKLELDPAVKDEVRYFTIKAMMEL